MMHRASISHFHKPPLFPRTQPAPERLQKKIDSRCDAPGRGAERGERDGGSDAPGQDRSEHDGGIFQRQRHVLRIFIKILTELVHHDGRKRLVAGNRNGAQRNDGCRTEAGDTARQVTDAHFDAVQEIRLFENACIGTGNRDERRRTCHGEHAATIQHGRERRIRAFITRKQHGEQRFQRHPLNEKAETDGRGDADEHGFPDCDAKERHDDDDQRGQKGQPAQRELFGELSEDADFHLARRAVKTGEAIEDTGEQEGHHRAHSHAMQISKQIRLRDRRDDQRARRERGAAVAKVDAAQDGTALKHLAHAHDTADRHADDTHGGGRPKGCADQNRQHGIQEKRQQVKRTGRNDLPGLIDKKGDRPARTPGRCDEPDEAENDEHHADRPDALPRQHQQLFDGKMRMAAIAEKDDVAEGQSIQH